jgi:histone deacetylase complex regulatory component SIN3
MQELQKNPEEEYDQILERKLNSNLQTQLLHVILIRVILDVYMKCILNMYRSNDEVIHVLRSRDKAKMGDIITKLEDKITEMKGLREQWNVVWAYTHYKHNLRSYDHQGQAFYVKDFKAMRPEGTSLKNLFIF